MIDIHERDTVTLPAVDEVDEHAETVPRMATARDLAQEEES